MKEFKAHFENYAEFIRTVGNDSTVKYNMKFLNFILEQASICGKTVIDLGYSEYYRDTDILTFMTMTNRRFYKVIVHVTKDVHGKRYVKIYDYSLEKRNPIAEREYSICRDYRSINELPYYIREVLFAL